MSTELENELISIIVPAYNHELYIGNCIESLISQSYQNLELIVLNDGSTDNTHQMIQSYTSRCETRFVRFVYINKKNEGITRTLNFGISKANGSFIFTLASDDKAADKNAIKILVEEMQKHRSNSLAVVCADMSIIDERGEKAYWTTNRKLVYKNIESGCFDTTTKYFTQWRKEFDGFDYLSSDFGVYHTLLIGHYMPNGALIKKSAFEDVGGFTPDICVEDWDLWLKLSKKYKFIFINKPLFECRWHSTNSQFIRDKEIRRDIYKLIVLERTFCELNNMVSTWDRAFRLARSGLISNFDLKYLYQNANLKRDYKFLLTDLILIVLHLTKRIAKRILPDVYFDKSKKIARNFIK